MVLIEFLGFKSFLYIFLCFLQYRALLLVYFFLKQYFSYIPRLISSFLLPNLSQFLHKIFFNQEQNKNLIFIYIFCNQPQILSNSDLILVFLFKLKNCILHIVDNSLV